MYIIVTSFALVCSSGFMMLRNHPSKTVTGWFFPASFMATAHKE